MLRLGRNVFAASALAASTPWVSPAAATSPGDLCSGNPCVVIGSVTVDAGSVLNFGGRELRFASGSVVRVGPGTGGRSVGFIADDIVLEPGAKILGDPSNANGDGDRALVLLESKTGRVELQSSGSTRAEVNVKADDIDAGGITIEAATDAIVGGLLTATAQGEDASGGPIEIAAGGNVSITQAVSAAAGGAFAGGGEISIAAGGDVSILAKLSTEGSDFGGGDMAVEAGGKVTIGGLLVLNGGDPDGEAGELEVVAGADVEVTPAGEVRGRGGAGPDEDCGDGAPIFVEAAGSLVLGGAVDIGGGFQCFGGDFDATVGLDVVQHPGSLVSTSTGGAYGAAGGVYLTAERAITLQKVDASSQGFGGDIDVASNSSIGVLNAVTVRASGFDGVGGRIMLTSCTVNVSSPDGSLDARGPFVFPGFGENVIRAGGPVTLTGSLRAATRNLVRYKTTPPVVTSATTPPVETVLDVNLSDCAIACGDGSLDGDEICDDGNLTSCDGCSSSCLPDAICGDGLAECSEQCDDGNVVSGDGCEADCTPTGQDVEGVLIRGRGNHGCQLGWLLQVDQPAIDKKGNPSFKQECVDGDPACDTDGVKNQECLFSVTPCVNLPEDECSGTVNRILMKNPLPGAGRDGANLANANALRDSLLTFGSTVEADGEILQAGGPIVGAKVCASEFLARVPFTGKSGKRKLRVRTFDVEGDVLKKSQLQMKCLRNDAVCGNGATELGEVCDDGNVVACDGCSAACRAEGCGNGLVECGEECDDGSANGTATTRCTARCTLGPTEVRIRGGGSKRSDCPHQWSMEFDAGDLARDRTGDARNRQRCTAGDPTCDVDPAPGCQVRLWSCFGAENPSAECAARSVGSFVVKRPPLDAKTASQAAARASWDAALAGVPLPVGPGEVCTGAIRADIPVGESLKFAGKAIGTVNDSDALRIDCE